MLQNGRIKMMSWNSDIDKLVVKDKVQFQGIKIWQAWLT